MLQCQCGSFYVGKIKQPFHKRASRHIASMRKACPDLSLGRHVREVHGGTFPRISFLILDRVHPNTRGGDRNKILLQRESRWIQSLSATVSPGLNDIISYRPFLEGFSSGGWEE